VAVAVVDVCHLGLLDPLKVIPCTELAQVRADVV
jgi:hypothetical protein